ncbi:hypothetical protein L1280_001013 [Deinococcus sp. HSC-46F16]|nr:hypothetical protein [Deinococcus sp. HSC-46F16]
MEGKTWAEQALPEDGGTTFAWRGAAPLPLWGVGVGKTAIQMPRPHIAALPALSPGPAA